MGRKNIPIPHIPLKFTEAVQEFLKVKPPKKMKPGPPRKFRKVAKKKR